MSVLSPAIRPSHADWTLEAIVRQGVEEAFAEAPPGEGRAALVDAGLEPLAAALPVLGFELVERCDGTGSAATGKPADLVVLDLEGVSPDAAAAPIAAALERRPALCVLLSDRDQRVEHARAARAAGFTRIALAQLPLDAARPFVIARRSVLFAFAERG